MANRLLVGLISIIGILIMLGGLDRYIFSKRISAVDPKALYYNVKSVIAQAQMQSVGTVLSGNADAAEFGSYRVVLATDHLVIRRAGRGIRPVPNLYSVVGRWRESTGP